jgi:hypothetical protein
MSEIYELAAYPTSHELYGGLTKREYFAAMVMQGMSALQDDRYWNKSCGMTVDEWQADIIARDAAHAVRVADALLAELAKEAK